VGDIHFIGDGALPAHGPDRLNQFFWVIDKADERSVSKDA
jgi:hypothetical protein